MKVWSVLFLIAFSTQIAVAGRFEFHMNLQYPAQSVLIDTQTGKLWRNNCYSEIKDGNCTVRAWAPENVIGVNATEAEMWKTVEAANKVNEGK